MQFIDKNLIRALAVSVWLLAAGTAHAAGTITGAAAGGSGGVGGGDASLAEQQTQTGLLTTIDGDTGTISTNSSTLAGAVKAEDAAHTTGDTGVMSLCVRRDTAVTSATTDGDYNPCQTDASGQLWVKEAGIGTSTDAAATAGGEGSLSAKLRNATALLDTLNTALSTLNAKFPSAATPADNTALGSMTSVFAINGCYDGSTVDLCVKATAETTGVQIVRPHALLADRVSGVVGITDGSSTSLVAAQGSGVRFCATTLVVSNSSATNVTVDIRDGTAGTVLMTIPAAANMGGGVVPLQMPLCTTANTIFAADPSAAASTVTISAVGFKTTL